MGEKIIFCVRSMDMVGGKERAVAKIASALCAYHTVGILNLNGHADSFYALNPTIKNYSLSTLSFLGRPKSFKTLLQFFVGIKTLARFIKHERPTMLIGNDFLVTIQLMLAKWYSRSNSILVGWEHLTLEEPIILSRRFLLRLRNACYQKLTALVVITPSDAHYCAKKNIKAHLIPYPRSFSFAGTVDYQQKKILTIARFSYQKGLDLYLSLISSLKDRLNGWTFLLVGQEDDIKKSALKNMIQQYGIEEYVKVQAPRKDVIELYKQASIYLLTSRYEGLPITLIEAQTCGLPCVSFDCKTGPADIITNGENGFIIPTFDIAGMGRKLEKLMDDLSLREKMGQAAKIASAHFNEEAVIQRWVDFLNNTITINRNK